MVNASFPYGKVVFFVTTNYHKFNEARYTLAKFNIATAMLKIKVSEIQDNNIENIAKTSALIAMQKSHLPIIVEDAGLFIESLNGFPGPYSKYVYDTIGIEGILTLLMNKENRKCYFKSAVVFSNPKGEVKCFLGTVEGTITDKIRGTNGFGFDPIFEPKDKPGKTFGEITIKEKNRISHRSKALKKFAEWYLLQS